MGFSLKSAGITLTGIVLVLLMLSFVFQTSAQEAGFEVVSRRVEVYATGVVYVVDTFIPRSPSATLEISLSEDMAASLVNAYIVGADAEVTVNNNIDTGQALIRVSPSGSWETGSKISLVTVLKDFLVETGSPNTYRLFILPAPRVGFEIGSMRFKLVAPPNTEIKSDIKQELSITSDSRKTVASLEFSNVNPAAAEPIVFTLTIPESEFNIMLDIIKAEINVENSETKMFVRITNISVKNLNNILFTIPQNADVISVSDGIRNLRFNVEENSLNVVLPYEIRTGEKIGLFIRMQTKDVAEHSDGIMVVHPPVLLNATVREYVIDIITPPGDYESIEPTATAIKRDFGPRTVLSYTFRDTVITPYTSIRMKGKGAFSVAAVTPYIWVGTLIFSILAVTTGKMVSRKKKPSVLPEDLQNLLRTIISSVQEAIKECNTLLSSLNPQQRKTTPPSKASVDARVNNIAKSLRIPPEARKSASRVGREAEHNISRIDKEAQEIVSTLRALARSYEDFKAGRISETVYDKIYNTYEKAISSSIADIRDYLAALRTALKQ